MKNQGSESIMRHGMQRRSIFSTASEEMFEGLCVVDGDGWDRVFCVGEGLCRLLFGR